MLEHAKDARHNVLPLRRDLALTLVEALEERIRLDVLKPGDKLPTEATLMSQFGVSRTVVRDALSRMKAAGRVQSHQGVGTFVAGHMRSRPFCVDGPDADSLADALAVLELRIGLESEAAALAAQRRTADDLQQIHHAYEALRVALAEEADTAFADLRFHLALSRASHSPHFASVLEALGPAAVSTSILERAHASHVNLAWELEVLDEHGSILGAIERQDAESARAAMRLHLTKSRERRRAASV
ncbi:FadR/GntR family transcriptional regulator [Variovorax sp. OV329]|uniref:FadR/GntR family transcriptional regulator n=1 Tax=Variovorax sp. OV329 TaxID=1882825 RepID=UPI0015878C4F|nr:FadR/GntR family transcriptional regulator [Variovorax sp. OV329]